MLSSIITELNVKSAGHSTQKWYEDEERFFIDFDHLVWDDHSSILYFVL